MLRTGRARLMQSKAFSQILDRIEANKFQDWTVNDRHNTEIVQLLRQVNASPTQIRMKIETDGLLNPHFSSRGVHGQFPFDKLLDGEFSNEETYIELAAQRKLESEYLQEEANFVRRGFEMKPASSHMCGG